MPLFTYQRLLNQLLQVTSTRLFFSFFPVGLFSFFFLRRHPPVLLLNSLFLSLTMKYSDTDLGGGVSAWRWWRWRGAEVWGSLDAERTAVRLSHFSCHPTPRLPALSLSATDSLASTVFLLLLHLLFPPPLFPTTPQPPPHPSSRHSLHQRMAASKIRAKQSQHSCEHLFCIGVLCAR